MKQRNFSLAQSLKLEVDPGILSQTTTMTLPTMPFKSATEMLDQESKRVLHSHFPSCSNISCPIYSREQQGGPFSLTNRDFGAHNVRVNDEFEVIGVIDLDGVMATPIEMVARFPVLTDLERATPGNIETEPLAIARIERIASKLQQYQSIDQKC